MNAQRGSLILEVILYILLISFFSAFLFKFVANEKERILRLASLVYVENNAEKMLSIFTRDVRQAPASTVLWELKKPDCIFWKFDDYKVGWFFTKNKIYRTFQSYNKKTKKWRKKSSVCLLSGVDRCFFRLVFDDTSSTIRSLNVSIKTKAECFYRDVSLNNDV